MNSFWTKMAVFGIIVVGLVVLVMTMSPKIEEALDVEKEFEKAEKLAEAQEARLQAELAEAEAKAEQAKAERAKANQPVPRSQPPKPEVRPTVHRPEASRSQTADIEELTSNLQAQKLYQMAETEFRIARKPLMSHRRCVDYCRQIIEKYPDSAEAAKAKVLLRKMPERERRKWRVSDEELGL